MANLDPGARAIIRRLVGVYNANGSVRGELAYFIGARLGRAHCALCDITHATVRERAEWKAFRASLPVPFDTYHLDDQPDALREVHQGRAPVVIAESDLGFVVLVGSEELSSCAASVDRLAAVIEAAVSRAGLDWPT